MANTEDRELEDILVKKDEPKRAVDKENATKKPAKLTGRTIASLKAKIKEDRMNKAYAKYNKKYQKMKKAAIEASNARTAKENGADITEAELAVDYSVAASYDKKLARMSVKLLKDEIKVLANGTAKESVAKRIKVPRFLLKKMKKIVALNEIIKTKNEERKLRKELKKETKQYIKTSLDGAFFKEDGTLQENIDRDVIKDLGLKGGKNNTERRLDTLKGFISLDGKTSLFEKTSSDELDKEVTTNTDLPPVEPTPTVNKGEEKVNVDKLLEVFGKKKETPEFVKEDTIDTPVVEEESKKEETITKKETDAIDSRNKEINEILTKADLINRIRTTLRKTTDPAVRAALETRLSKEKAEFDEMIKVGTKEETKSLEPIEVKETTKQQVEKTPQPDGTKDVRPTYKEPQKEMEHVKVNKPEEMRVSQVSSPVALSITIEDRKKLEERNKNAKAELERLKKERATLESQKHLLSEYVGLYQMTEKNELQVEQMTAGNATLKEEVAELNSQAATIQSTLGKTK